LTPISIKGVTEKNYTLAPRSVQGVDQVTIGIVMPRQLVGLVFRQPQSAVLAKYRPCGRGAPAGSPTVSPGCVTDPARAAEISVHVHSAPPAAAAVSLLFISRRSPPTEMPPTTAHFYNILGALVSRCLYLSPISY
jgi:hypothetical protein